MVEIKAHDYTENGLNKHADCFPFVNGSPVLAIANCGYCKLNNQTADFCDGWADNPSEAPLFCGPICPKFDLVDEMAETIKYL